MRHAPGTGLVGFAATLLIVAVPAVLAQEPEPPSAAPFPTADELRELVASAESVALRPHAVKLESFRGDTISGVFLVDSDLPTARHVAFGHDAQGHRYVWFSRQNPLRANLVAMYDVDGRGLPDVLYWKQTDHEAMLSRAREFRAPAAEGVVFEYASGRGCGKARCDERWRDLPLERIDVAAEFLEPVRTLFDAAAKHGEPHLDRPVATLRPDRARHDPGPPVTAVVR